jgi:Fic family protein
VSGLFSGLPNNTQMEAIIDMMVAEAVKTSAIEGEYVSRKDVMSSVRRNLGLGDDVKSSKDEKAEGAGALMVDVRNTFAAPLSNKKLFEWHRMVMAGSRDIQTGQWRTHAEPMQVASGPVGKEKVHFEAPPSARVPQEMKRFIAWFNDTGPGGTEELKKPVVRSAIAHLYFESIHPFEDGNGRIGRAISEKALSQGLGRPVLLSLSRTIEANRKQYYAALHEAQRSNEITSWITWFANTVLRAQIEAEEQIDFTLKKTRLFDRFRDHFNERQLQVLQRMLEEGPKGFEGEMSAKKYMSITGASKASATRDLQDLAEQGVLVPFGGGRSTRYNLSL